MIALAEIGKQVAAARSGRRLRQADLAMRAGLSRATIDALENGRAGEIGFSKLLRILSVVGLELKLQSLSTSRPTLDQLLQESSND